MRKVLAFSVPLFTLLTVIACGDRPSFEEVRRGENINGIYRSTKALESEAAYESLSYTEYEIADGRLFFRRTDEETGEPETFVIGEVKKNGGIAYDLIPAADIQSRSKADPKASRFVDWFADGRKVRLVIQKGKLLLTSGERTPVIWRQIPKAAADVQRSKVPLKEFKALRAAFVDATKDKNFSLKQIVETQKVSDLMEDPTAPDVTAKPEATEDIQKPVTPDAETTIPQREPQSILKQPMKAAGQRRQQTLRQQLRRRNRTTERKVVTSGDKVVEEVKLEDGRSRINIKILKVVSATEALINGKHKAKLTFHMLKPRFAEKEGSTLHRLVVQIVPDVDEKIYDVKGSTVTAIVVPNEGFSKGFNLSERNRDGQNMGANIKVVHEYAP